MKVQLDSGRGREGGGGADIIRLTRAMIPVRGCKGQTGVSMVELPVGGRAVAPWRRRAVDGVVVVERPCPSPSR